MSARVYFMKMVNGCKEMACLCKMNSEDGQTFSMYITAVIFFTKYTPMQSKHKQTNYKHSRQKSYGLQLSQ